MENALASTHFICNDLYIVGGHMVDDSFQENPFTTRWLAVSNHMEVMDCHKFIHVLQECLASDDTMHFYSIEGGGRVNCQKCMIFLFTNNYSADFVLQHHTWQSVSWKAHLTKYTCTE